ncbi:helix-turn-helix domain-containing protein [Streptomyces sp. RY43-2]|uniref:Helix-turn-helix domain-containing protein n=1 Tax=Streptomyces macrolidinus TaxID=2952607 RepID=A0ABT0ZFD8_9ACTN|nr:helix-turn-helix domain-containing protein [Streptomyces macrolidinus]MCN9242292.1 helix-turn-helix domain-containing protein [Streptomyces macrolidinus]
MSNALMPSTFMPRDPDGFYAEGAVLDPGRAQLTRFIYSLLRSKRTPALIRRGDPEQYQLGLVSRGSAWFSQNGAEAELQAGDMALWDTSLPYESGSGMDGGDVEVFVLQIPKTAWPLPSREAQRLLARPVRGGVGFPAVLSDILVSVAGNGPDCRPGDLTGLGDIALELAVSCMAQQCDQEEDVRAPVRSQALLRQINSFIEHRLVDPDLTPRQMAEHHHISLRTLYTLFKEQREGVSGSIRRRRLERCRDDLSRPDQRDYSVEAIAARWGFHDPSAFARTFRNTYGASPSQFRRQAEAAERRERRCPR